MLLILKIINIDWESFIVISFILLIYGKWYWFFAYRGGGPDWNIKQKIFKITNSLNQPVTFKNFNVSTTQMLLRRLLRVLKTSFYFLTGFLLKNKINLASFFYILLVASSIFFSFSPNKLSSTLFWFSVDSSFNTGVIMNLIEENDRFSDVFFKQTASQLDILMNTAQAWQIESAHIVQFRVAEADLNFSMPWRNSVEAYELRKLSLPYNEYSALTEQTKLSTTVSHKLVKLAALTVFFSLSGGLGLPVSLSYGLFAFSVFYISEVGGEM